MKRVAKRAQIAIWIILAVILIGSIVVVFIFRNEPKLFKPEQSDAAFDLQPFLETCTREAVLEAVEIMLPQGGFIEPRNVVGYDGKEVAYICEISAPYSPCMQQHPVFFQDIKNEIEDYITPKVEDCFAQIEEEYADSAGHLNIKPKMDIEIELASDKVIVNIEREVVVEKQEERRTFNEFEVEVTSPIYNLARVVIEISAQEGDPQRCYFEHIGYSLTYPRFNIEMYNLFPDGTKVFTIHDKKSNKFMRTATRSCVILRGL